MNPDWDSGTAAAELVFDARCSSQNSIGRRIDCWVHRSVVGASQFVVLQFLRKMRASRLAEVVAVVAVLAEPVEEVQGGVP